jgi:predicted proteasome-type protease
MRMTRWFMMGAAGIIAATAGSLAIAQSDIDVSAPPPSLTKLNPQPGQCFARVMEPAKYETETEKVLVREASQKVEIAPAKLEWTQEQIVVKDAMDKLVAVAPEYETVTETIELEPARQVWRAGSSAKAPLGKLTTIAAATKLGLPTTPEPGKCYAEYASPTKYETREEKVLVREASAKFEIEPPQWEWREQKVLIEPEREKLVEVPAQYETVTQQIVEQPATKVWKKGRGLIEKVDHATGDIMCLVEVPAKMKTVKKRVVKTPATTKTIRIPAKHRTMKVRKLVKPAQPKQVEIPAKYETLAKRVKVRDGSVVWRLVGLDGPGEATGRKLCGAEIAATTKKVAKQVVKTKALTKKSTIPAEEQTIKVQRLVAPAQSKKVAVPAQYTNLERRKLVAQPRLEWLPVLCETNMSQSLVTDLQRALQRAGFNPGDIDGMIGRQTLTAVDEFQRTKNLARGGLTLATLDALGVKDKSAE